MSRARPRSARAFSLVEVIVVVSIIALLLSLAGIGANAWINSNRVRDTEATMLALEQAIRDFSDANPLVARPIDGNGTSYGLWFGQWPPCPVTPWMPPPAIPGPQPALNESIAGQAQADAVVARMNHLVGWYLRSQGEPRQWLLAGGKSQFAPPEPTRDYASIECLVLFLTQFSPAAKAKIGKLPQKNLDNDRALPAGWPSAAPIDLVEIVDSWGNPLRWAVLPHDQNVDANKGLPVRWELRSAGKDGVFSPPFTPAGQGDDVVWPKGNSR